MPFVFILPEQEKKTIDLEQNSNNGPANQHHKHSSQEETGGLHLVLLEKEAEGPLKADDKGESSNKENLQKQKREWKHIREGFKTASTRNQVSSVVISII